MNAVSDKFRKMAERVDLNAADAFGGAFVIVPPGETAEGIETLILDNKQSEGQFWAALKTKCEIELNEVIERERGQQAPYGRR